MVQFQRIATIVLCGATFVGCQKPTETTNAALVGQFSGDDYQEDMTTTEEYTEHADQGASISLRVQKGIQDKVEAHYIEDFERCLSQEMERLENVNVSGSFSVEFTIQPTGKVTKANVIESDIQERKAAAQGESLRNADEFDGCLEGLALQWEFDPPPEVVYTHTYTGQVGEAW